MRLDRLAMGSQHLDAFQDYLVGVRRFSQRSVSAYVTDVRGYLVVSAGRPASGAIQAFVDALPHLSAGTVRRKVAAVRCYFRYREVVGLEVAPDEPVILPKKNGRLPRCLSPDQIAPLLKELRFMPLRDQLLVQLAYTGGLRVSELAGLRVRNIDMHRGVIQLVGKGARERIVPIGLEVGRLISQYIRIQSFQFSESSDFLFSSSRSGGLSTRAIQLVIKRVSVIARLPEWVSVHSLRHSAATHLLRDGATVRDVQAFLGHQCLSTTQIYTQLVSGQLRLAVQSAHPRY